MDLTSFFGNFKFFFFYSDFILFCLSIPALIQFLFHFYWVLIGFTGFYWVLLGFIGFYRVLSGFIGFLLGFTKLY